MSVLITALVVGCGMLAGRLLVHRPRVSKRTDPPDVAESSEEAPPQKEPGTLEGFPCQLGDVIMRKLGDEAWLAGALVLSETSPAIALFISPEAGAMRVVLARPESEELLWLTETTGVSMVAGEPPSTLELGTDRFDRRRRLPFRVERRGTGAPDMGTDVIFAEYTGLADSALVVVVAKEKVLALLGEVLAPGTMTSSRGRPRVKADRLQRGSRRPPRATASSRCCRRS